MVRVIDVHNHLFPAEWIDYLENSQGPLRVERTGPASLAFYAFDTPISNVYTPGHYDPGPRIEDMDRCGIDTQILSLTVPSVEFLPADEGVEWAKKINDYFAYLRDQYPGRFYAYATLPYQNVAAAVKELDRAYRQLGVKGITIFSNINGKPIASPEFYPIYAKAAEYGLPIFVHPGIPFTLEVAQKHKLAPGLYGFTLDTSMAVVSLIWQGVLERYPKLSIIHAHLGGVVPYLVQRMEECWQTSSVAFNLKLSRPPSEYYQRQVYPDSVSGYLPAMRCCLDFVGPRHICFGTDYAHRVGDWEHATDYVKQMRLTEDDTNNILGGNAARIFHLQ